MTVLACDKVFLRPVRKLGLADAESLAKHANNRRVWSNLRDHFPHPYELKDALAFIERADEDDYAIALRTSPEASPESCPVIGTASLIKNHVDRTESHSREVGFWLGEEFWGCGIATQVIAALVAFAFGPERCIHRLYASVKAGNEPSSRALLRNGFVLEGCLRQDMLKDGQFYDRYIYGLIKQ